jgi:hypothetical protein
MATNNAAFISQQVPHRIYEDLTPLTALVTMRNTGDTIWVNFGDNPYRLGSQNPQDNENWGLNRVDLAYPVSPGDEYTFSFTLDPSLLAHHVYNFQWQMVQEGVAWFGDTTPNVPIDVEISGQ